MAEKIIELIIVGAGEGFYQKVFPTLSALPELRTMRVATVVDVLPQEQLHEKTQHILKEHGIPYINEKVSPIENIPLNENSAVVLLTPNEFHTPYAERFFKMRKDLPIDVEKPPATSLADLEKLLKIAGEGGRIYAAEPTVDGKCIGLLWAAGAIPDDDPCVKYLSLATDMTGTGPWTIHDHFRSLGRLVSVRGAMLEGSGTAATADHRAWLLEGNHGGMIRDLVSHLCPFFDLGTGCEIQWENVELGKYEAGFPLGTWRPLRQPNEGETYASMKGILFAPWGKVPFFLEVGKYMPAHNRYLLLVFEHGTVRLNYESPFVTAIETPYGTVEVKNRLKEYQGLSLLDFKRFIEGETHGHIGRAAAIVRFNETAREFGLKKLGL